MIRSKRRPKIPTSNGQISARDIRQKAIKTPHLIDSAVTTAKISDVAVTVAKTDEPVWTYVERAPTVVDFALTTTAQEVMSTTIDIPSWVGRVDILATVLCQISNSSGGVQGAIVGARLNDEASGEVTNDVANGQVGGSVFTFSFSATSPGATIELSNYSRVSTGTNSSNAESLHVTVIGTR